MNPLKILNEVIKSPRKRSKKLIKLYKSDTLPESKEQIVFCVMHPITLENGGRLSVQASYTHYCLPKYSNEGPYTHVEIGFPQGITIPASWEEYADYSGEDWRQADIFSYVPVDMVKQLILDHCPSLKNKTK